MSGKVSWVKELLHRMHPCKPPRLSRWGIMLFKCVINHRQPGVPLHRYEANFYLLTASVSLRTHANYWCYYHFIWQVNTTQLESPVTQTSSFASPSASYGEAPFPFQFTDSLLRSWQESPPQSQVSKAIQHRDTCLFDKLFRGRQVWAYFNLLLYSSARNHYIVHYHPLLAFFSNFSPQNITRYNAQAITKR